MTGHFDVVSELERWMQIRERAGLSMDGPLFCFMDGTGITTSDVRDEVKRLMAAQGMDPALFGAHSLRIGGGTVALAAGVPPALIRLMGRWSSDVYDIYCRMSMQSGDLRSLGTARAVQEAAPVG